jgi:hypothetical protein
VAETVIRNDRRTNANTDTDSYTYTISNADHDTYRYAKCHTNGDTYCNAKCTSESHTNSESDFYAYNDSGSNSHADFYTKTYPDPKTSPCAAPSPDTTALRRG